jgi:hypothetical protein
LEGSRASITPHPHSQSLFVGPLAVTVRTNDIALTRLFEQFRGIDATEHSRQLEQFLRRVAMIEVHRVERKGLLAVGARNVTQAPQQRRLVAAQSTFDHGDTTGLNS